MSNTTLTEDLIQQLEVAVKGIPVQFFDTFQYTETGNNMTHPIVWGFLTKILWSMPTVNTVGIDVRLNKKNGPKFQPDLIAYDAARKPIVYIDYESPNSSDARIPFKDIDPYIKWRDSGESAPYVVLTTLPNYQSPKWQLRYTAKTKKYYNYPFRDKRKEIRSNPFRFWYSYYIKEFSTRKMAGVSMINISGKSVALAYTASA